VVPFFTSEYIFSPKSFYSWRTPENSTIPCSTVQKGAVRENEIIFAGFDGNG